MKETVVALSGTLETFSLPDVLRLLSSTNKTGLLALDGDRGRGRIWVRDGAIVAAEADRAAGEALEGVAFELLRFVEASFEFDSGAAPAVDGDSSEVDDVLAEAESRLAEWREIEAVVPSLDVWVRMVAELDADRTVTAPQWRVLAQVGTGATGHDLAERLQQGEYDVCRQLRDLVEDGMVELGDAPVATSVPGDVTILGTDLASFVAVGTVEEAIPVDFREPDPEPEPEIDDAEDGPAEEPAAFAAMEDTAAVPAPDEVEIEVDDDDVLSQLSHLSPKAAAAVEATWTEDTPGDEPAEEPPADDAAPAASGDDIDQNLLLRFLSSAKS